MDQIDRKAIDRAAVALYWALLDSDAKESPQGDIALFLAVCEHPAVKRARGFYKKEEGGVG